MRRRNGSRFVIFYVLGGLISFVCKRQNWNRSQEGLLEVFGVVLSLTGYIWALRVPLVEFSSCGIKGWLKI